MTAESEEGTETGQAFGLVCGDPEDVPSLLHAASLFELASGDEVHGKGEHVEGGGGLALIVHTASFLNTLEPFDFRRAALLEV